MTVPNFSGAMMAGGSAVVIEPQAFGAPAPRAGAIDGGATCVWLDSL